MNGEDREFPATAMAFLLGLLAGAAAGLLLAPKPGRETRSAVKDFATGLRDKVRGGTGLGSYGEEDPERQRRAEGREPGSGGGV